MPMHTAPWKSAAESLRERFGEPPVAALILGSGVGGLVDRLDGGEAVPYAEVGLPVTGVVGHAGKVRVGTLGGRHVAAFAGRVHLYEGIEMEAALRTVRALAGWGVPRVVLTSAVGSLRADIGPGTLVRISDHINFSGRHALMGPNDPELGPRFPDLARAYNPADGELVADVAEELGIELMSGVYLGVHGPNYETAAEVRAFGELGGTVVGMSLLHEVVAACHAGLRTTAICVVSNLACGLSKVPLSHEDVTHVVEGAAGRLGRLVEGLVERW